MEEIIDLTGGLKLSMTEVYMEAQEMEGLNEIMNEDDLDSDEEEFFYKVPGMGLPQTTLISLINVGPMLTDFEQFHPPQKNIYPPRLLIP